ncbi:hypothetical protein XH98_21640 [Bradyrhizobium sp. CCBAU 51745]|uniref:hypothetical protein n=1 Tax=Bradyrhizobium sp. CCBAU 51745 TaxID=1325099 RepID=UPI00230560BC|nr:hypothetical protein [Bradyrhizobium sp. CCBAU 51745]MDA9441639.1 hypothetical protein [Bradyrhizobium sp. CCBAU 51745]
MKPRCRVNGCANPRAGHSLLCSKHRSRKRRHGHEEQRTISKGDLKPFIEKVQARIAKRPDAKLWAVLDQRWDIVTTKWRAELPTTLYRYVRAGMKELLRLADTVSGRDVAVTVIAMYLLQDYDPRLFKDEAGFRTQLVRRVRTLSSTSFSHWSGASDGRERRAMKELEPRTAEYLSGLLVELFGPAGVRVAQVEKREEEDQRKERLAYYEALGEVE